MKSFLHISVSLILGIFLTHTLYQKVMPNKEIVQATDMDVDPLFYTDETAYNQKQLAVSQPEPILPSASVSQKIASMAKADSLAKQSTPNLAKATQTATKQIKRKIEVNQLKNSVSVPLTVQQVKVPELTEAASAQLTENTTGAIAAATVSEPASSEPVQPEKKKKFLFFNRKGKEN